MMGSGMAAHEWRGPHLLHEKVEALEKENIRLQQEREMLQLQANALHQVASALGCFEADDDVTIAPWVVARVVRERDTLQDQVKLLRDALIHHQKLTRPIEHTYKALAATDPKES